VATFGGPQPAGQAPGRYTQAQNALKIELLSIGRKSKNGSEL
jgi:hypothetical protein